jgi:hypothetical protein
MQQNINKHLINEELDNKPLASGFWPLAAYRKVYELTSFIELLVARSQEPVATEQLNN